MGQKASKLGGLKEKQAGFHDGPDELYIDRFPFQKERLKPVPFPRGKEPKYSSVMSGGSVFSDRHQALTNEVHA